MNIWLIRFGRMWALWNAPYGGVCAEIGVWKGRFSKRISKLRRPAELHLIDPWAFQSGYTDKIYGGIVDDQKKLDLIVSDVRQMFLHDPTVRIHRLKSVEAAAQFADNYFDWIYIDGDHTYEGVLADAQAWFGKLKPGGVMVFDDYSYTGNSGEWAVKRATDDFLAKHPCKHKEFLDNSQSGNDLAKSCNSRAQRSDRKGECPLWVLVV